MKTENGAYPDDSTLERYREAVTKDRSNKQGHVRPKDAKKIAKATKEVETSGKS